MVALAAEEDAAAAAAAAVVAADAEAEEVTAAEPLAPATGAEEADIAWDERGKESLVSQREGGLGGMVDSRVAQCVVEG